MGLGDYRMVKLFKEIMFDVRLETLEEKVIVSYIWDWQVKGKCCFASDEFLCNLTGRSAHENRNVILSLAQRKIVRITYPITTSTRMLSVIGYGLHDVPDCSPDMDIFTT